MRLPGGTWAGKREAWSVRRGRAPGRVSSGQGERDKESVKREAGSGEALGQGEREA